MIIYIILLFSICLYGVRFSSFHKDYMSLESTNALRGIFAVLILFSHMRGYIHLGDNIWDQSYDFILNKIGQLMVAPYFFLSGFGIMESAKRKERYFEDFPRKRILKTLLHFDLAVLLYIIAQSIIGVFYPPLNYLTCWIGLSSVGNSNWFIFVILLLYILVYLTSIITSRFRLFWFPIAISGLSIVAIFSIWSFHPGNWWYNTILTFPLGIWYSTYKSQIDNYLSHNVLSWIIIFCSTAVFLFWYILRGIDGLGVCSCLFTLLLIFASTKIKLNNIILQRLGTLAFSLYIMQRLPLNILSHYWGNTNTYIFSVIGVTLAIVIAYTFDKALRWVDNVVFDGRTR